MKKRGFDGVIEKTGKLEDSIGPGRENASRGVVRPGAIERAKDLRRPIVLRTHDPE